MLILDIIFFAVSCTVLVKSSGLVVKAIIKISHFLKLNDFVLGFIIMSVSTSLPELLVGVVSSANNKPTLGLGTAIGSVIVNLTLVIGIVTLLARKIPIRSKIIRKDLGYMMLVVIAPLILMTDHLLWKRVGIDVQPGISRIDGIILLTIFALYVMKIISQKNRFKTGAYKVTVKETMNNFISFFFFVSLLIISAQFTVKYADLLSTGLGVSNIFMGLFVLAIGTSLPELAFSTKAVLSRHEEMAIGDLAGSAVTDSTLVLGISAVISPIYGDLTIFISSSIFMLLIAFIFYTFAESGHELTWKEGMCLILLYFFFTIIQINFNKI